jgi:hypothetical protein
MNRTTRHRISVSPPPLPLTPESEPVSGNVMLSAADTQAAKSLVSFHLPRPMLESRCLPQVGIVGVYPSPSPPLHAPSSINSLPSMFGVGKQLPQPQPSLAYPGVMPAPRAPAVPASFFH